jgi:hypothetical protein
MTSHQHEQQEQPLLQLLEVGPNKLVQVKSITNSSRCTLYIPTVRSGQLLMWVLVQQQT